MIWNFNHNISRRTLAIGSILLVVILCTFFIGFVQQFIEYAMNMLYLAARTSTHYLNIVPPQINH